MEDETRYLHSRCQLLHQDEEMINELIHTGIFISFRRNIWKWFTLDKNHPNTQLYYQSETSRREEQKRHITLYKYRLIIHPFSLHNFYWEIFMFFTYIYMLFVYALDDMHIFRRAFSINVFKLIGDSIFLLDVIHFFFQGYYSTEKSKTVLLQKHIIEHYLKTYFLVDLIAISPSIAIICDWLEYIDGENSPIFLLVSIFGIVRLLRIPRWLNVIDLFKSYKDYPHHIFKAAKIIFIYVVCLFVSYTAMIILFNNIYAVKHTHLSFSAKRYLVATMIIMLAAVGSSEHLDTYIYTVEVIIVFTIAAFVLQMYLYANIFRMWNIFFIARNKIFNHFLEIQHYLQSQGIPIALRNRVTNFIDFKFQIRCYDEEDINYLVSHVLRQRVMLHLARKHLGNCRLIQNLPDRILFKLVAKFNSEIYLPNDFIIAPDSRNKHHNIYFIYFGRVAVYDSKGSEICHLEDGESFGEEDALCRYINIGSVVAVSACELFRLRIKDLFNILEDFPDLKDTIITEARERQLRLSEA